MPFPYIFTFYSFKGGVGRSMALMNTAYRLAGWGRHVLIVDMDLEAPGVSNFLSRNKELSPPIGAHPRDVLALLHEARFALEGEGTIEEKAARLPPLDPYLRSVLPEKLALLQPKIGQLGRLDVLGSNFEASYAGRLATLGLKDLPNERLAALSALLHFYFKARRFPHRPLGLPDFEPPVSTPYDYILVDSRTGLTETGGLCIGPLADRLVVLTGLNDQNVDGTRHFFIEAGIRIGPRQPWDDADPVNEDDPPPTLGPKPTILVASPIPVGELTFKRQRLAQLETQLGVRPLPLSYHPQLAFQETVFVRDYPEEYLARDYDALADRMMNTVSDGFRTLVFPSGTQRAADNPGGAVRTAIRLAQIEADLGLVQLKYAWDNSNASAQWKSIPFLEKCSLFAHLAHSSDPETASAALNNWGVTLSRQAKTKPGEEADRLFASAGEKYAEALRRKPDYADAFINWGNELSERAKTKTGEEADRLFASAREKYAEAVRLKADDTDALNNWGNVLSDQAKTKTGEEADRLFASAGVKYAEAVRLKPDYAVGFNNWGSSLHDQAVTKQGEEADRLFASAGEKFAEAVRLQPDLAKSFNNWGNALYDQAKTKPGEVADRLFASAGEKFAEAVRLQPDHADAFNNWGSALSDQAKTKQGEEADRLFASSGEKFAEAIRLKPDHADAFNNWGAALSHQAKTKQGEEAERLLVEAREKVQRAEEISTGSGAYNLAYLSALAGDAADAVHWLQVALQHEKTTLQQIESDSDFDPVRDHPLFADFLESLRNPPSTKPG